MLDFTKKFGKAICVVLYAVLAWLAGKKHPVPLLVLLLTHTAEYFTKARPIAKKHSISPLSAFFNCLCFGFTWWLPIRENENKSAE